jgi:acetyl esterase
MGTVSEIDPEIVSARTRQAGDGQPVDITSLPAAVGRRVANAAAMFFNDGLPRMRQVTDHYINSRTGSIRLRLFDPHKRSGPAAIFYVHGGGWFHCNVETHERTMRFIAEMSGLPVFGVDFRLAPEHPFPEPLEDCLTAWQWLCSHAETFGCDRSSLGVAGDSAGANLGLALCIHQRDTNGVMPAAGALFYGCYAADFSTDSYKRFGGGQYGVTTERMRWYWSNFLGPNLDRPPQLAVPLTANLRGLPPLFLGIAELDPVADDSRILAARLCEAGVSAELEVWPRAVHGFLQMTRDVAIARIALANGARFLSLKCQSG